MHVGTYPTRYFATLEPSELQLPFTSAYKLNHLNLVMSPTSTGQASDPIQSFTILQSPVFLLNSRPSLFFIPFPEVTGLICRVPSKLLFQRLSILYPSTSVSFSTVYILNFSRNL